MAPMHAVHNTVNHMHKMNTCMKIYKNAIPSYSFRLYRPHPHPENKPPRPSLSLQKLPDLFVYCWGLIFIETEITYCGESLIFIYMIFVYCWTTCDFYICIFYILPAILIYYAWKQGNKLPYSLVFYLNPLAQKIKEREESPWYLNFVRECHVFAWHFLLKCHFNPMKNTFSMNTLSVFLHIFIIASEFSEMFEKMTAFNYYNSEMRRWKKYGWQYDWYY